MTERVALVHDWLTGMRGGEKVLEVLCGMYPSADLLTLVHVPGTVSPAIERLRPKTSFLQRLPGIRRFYRHCLPLFPIAIEQFDLDGYDLIISTSHCAAKAVVKTGAAPRAGRPGPLGRRHRRPRGPICGYFSARCQQDPSVL
jgi:hypothetical protein